MSNLAHRNVSDAGKDRSEGIPNSKVPGGSHSTDNAIWYKAHSSPHPVDKHKPFKGLNKIDYANNLPKLNKEINVVNSEIEVIKHELAKRMLVQKNGKN